MLLTGWRSRIDMYLFGMWRREEAASDHLGETHWLQRYVTSLSYLLAFDSSPNFFAADHSQGMWKHQVDDVWPGVQYLWDQTYTERLAAAKDASDGTKSLVGLKAGCKRCRYVYSLGNVCLYCQAEKSV
jgi:hypothetical protein